MPRVWFSFWDGLFGSSFSLPLFCWPFMVSFVYVLYALSFLVNILLFIDQKKKKKKRTKIVVYFLAIFVILSCNSLHFLFSHNTLLVFSIFSSFKMAEQILLNILTKLGSSATQRIGSAFGVTKELTKLTMKLDTINGVLLDAEKKREESDAVKAWVRRLKDVVYEPDNLLDEFETLELQPGGVSSLVGDLFLSSNQLLFRVKMSNRVKNIKDKNDEIVKEIPLLNLIQGNIFTHRGGESNWRETHSFVLTSQIVGREENKKEIIKSLVSFDNEETLSMAAIVGIRGLGKTILAQLVYNDPRIVEYFKPRIWVCVS